MQESLTPYQKALHDIEAAKEKAEELRRQEVDAVIQDMKVKIALYAITAKDIGLEMTGVVAPKKPRPGMEQTGKDLRSNVKPKYRSEEGDEWSGRGKAPGWVTQHILLGRGIDELLIIKKRKNDE